MSLQRTKLLGIQSVTGISTVGIFTAGTTQTAAGVAGTTYIRGVVMHNTGLSTATASLYVYPSAETVSGAGNTSNRLGRVDLSSNETFFFEMNYPLVLNTGEKIAVDVIAPANINFGAGIGSMVNFQILGDTDI